MASLAKAHGVSAEASNKAVEAVKKVGFGTEDAIHAVDRLMIADINLSKSGGACEGRQGRSRHREHHACEDLEKLLMAIESRARADFGPRAFSRI